MSSSTQSSRAGSKGAKPAAPGPLKRKYLILYNGFSCFLWAAVLLRFAVLFPLVGSKFVCGGLNDFLRWVQTLMVLDVVHAITGVVRASPVTTTMQILSRLVVVWGVLYPFPEIGESFAFSTCTLAWCFTEILRYLFHWYTITRGSHAVPKWLVWIRYSAFFILYPLGAGSEWILMLLSLSTAETYSTLYALLLKAILLIYIPGFYILYTHVIKQRKKVLGGSKLNPELEKKKKV